MYPEVFGRNTRPSNVRDEDSGGSDPGNSPIEEVYEHSGVPDVVYDYPGYGADQLEGSEDVNEYGALEGQSHQEPFAYPGASRLRAVSGFSGQFVQRIITARHTVSSPGISYQTMDQASNPILRISDDRQELEVVIPWRDSSVRWKRLSYAIVGLRWLSFQEGKLLVGWCKGGGCSKPSKLGKLLTGCPGSEGSADNFFPTPQPGEDSMCSDSWCACCTAAVDAVGGTEGLQTILAAAETTVGVNHGTLVVDCGAAKQAVRAGDSFGSWGLVVWDDTNVPVCQTCPRSKSRCEHVQVLIDPMLLPAQSTQGLPKEEFEEKLSKELEGMSPCISRGQLPEELEDNISLLQTVTGKAFCSTSKYCQEVLISFKVKCLSFHTSPS